MAHSTTQGTRRTNVALAVASALALSALTGEASAAVYAGSKLFLEDLEIVFGGPDGPGQNVSAVGFDFTTTNTAVLNGNPVIRVSNCQGTTIPTLTNNCPSGVNAAQAFATPGNSIAAPPEDTYTFQGPNSPNETFSRSDSIIDSAEALGGGVTATRNIAEGELQTLAQPQAANSNSEIGSTTNFTFSFTVAQVGFMNVSFRADPELLVQIDAEAEPNATAEAEIGWAFSLSRDSTNSEISWEPNGAVAVGDCKIDDNGDFGSVTCSETNDAESLNEKVQIGSIPSGDSYSSTAGFSLFGIAITNLPTGNYTLDLTEFKTVSLTNGAAVPLPGVLSLLGVGILGLGFVRRRNRAA